MLRAMNKTYAGMLVKILYRKYQAKNVYRAIYSPMNHPETIERLKFYKNYLTRNALENIIALIKKDDCDWKTKIDHFYK